METQRSKSLNTNTESSNRFRFASSRQRASRVTADVYRSYKRKGGSGSAFREETIHTLDAKRKNRKRLRSHEYEKGESDSEENFDRWSAFADELNLAHDRNPSEEFRAFYNEMWPMTRSLPEILHHLGKIIDCLLSRMLTHHMSSSKEDTSDVRSGYIVNHATSDILHLLAVLARDLRHEIHVFVYTKILPRIVSDLINPPSSGNHPFWVKYSVDVQIVESAFRTLSYIFRYDAQMLVQKGSDKNAKNEACLEPMRRFYGQTLGHKSEYVRKLAAESFAPLIQKLSNHEKRKHVKKIMKALAVVCNRATSKVRSETHAVHGLSLLFFYMVKGIPGRMHSKGLIIVEAIFDCFGSCKLENGQEAADEEETYRQSENKVNVYSKVINLFVLHLCKHLTPQNFGLVWNQLRRLLKSKESTQCALSSYVLSHILNLMDKCVLYNKGYLLRENEKELERMFSTIQHFFESKYFWNGAPQRYSKVVRKTILTLLCSCCSLHPNHPTLVSHQSNFFKVILGSSSSEKNGNDGSHECQLDPAFVISKKLLPLLPLNNGIREIAPVIINHVCNQKLEGENKLYALLLVHSIATMKPRGTAFAISDKPNSIDTIKHYFYTLNCVDFAEECILQESYIDVLKKECLSNSWILQSKANNPEWNEKQYECFILSVQCTPFLAYVGCVDRKKMCHTNEILKWLESCLKNLNQRLANGFLKRDSKTVIASSLLIESISAIAIKLNESESTNPPNRNFANKVLNKMRKPAYDFLCENNKSSWALKSLCYFTKALEKASLRDIGELTSTSDDLFDLLNPNLCSSNHMQRYYTLMILKSLPPKRFVTNIADLDLVDDLDEELESTRQNKYKNSSGTNDKQPSSLLSGPCQLFEVLISIESMPLDLPNERNLVSQIQRVEVLCRSGKLPAVYSDAAINHMLGVLHMKFAPLWAPARQVLLSLSNDNTAIWSPLYKKVEECLLLVHNTDLLSVNKSGRDEKSGVREVITYTLDTYNNGSNKNCTVSDQITSLVRLCVEWQNSQERHDNIYDKEFEDGSEKSPRFLKTDNLTVNQNVWKIFQDAPKLTTMKSKIIVPLFLEFLHHQYFQVVNNCPDKRELCIEDYFDVFQSKRTWRKENLQLSEVSCKLLSFLQVFSVVNGPQQLFKHQLLHLVFLSLLSNKDLLIAQTAFDCLMKYSHQHLVPYAEPLRQIITKGELRESIIRFDVSIEGGCVDSHHRETLIPILTRLVFGRFAAKNTSSRKSDPTSTRRALLSFFAKLNSSNNELDNLVYLMVRIFIPKGISMKIPYAEESNDAKHRIRNLIDASKLLSEGELHTIPSQNMIGFLNLLIDAIAQIGFGLLHYIDVFYVLVLKLCSFSEVKGKVNFGYKSEEPIECNEAEAPDNIISAQRVKIRNLCYRSLLALFKQFSGSYDFAKEGHKLWSYLENAIAGLPSSVISASKPPSLLTLLECISSYAELLPLLQLNLNAVRVVYQCISSESSCDVYSIVLKFINNLLLENEDNLQNEESNKLEPVGLAIFQASDTDVLLKRFAEKLRTNSNFGNRGGSKDSVRKNASGENNVMRSNSKIELDILCRISKVVGKAGDKVETKEEICSLLLHHLKHGKNTNEYLQFDVLGTINSFIPRLRFESAQTYLSTLSKMMGPNKCHEGIQNPQIRNLIVTSISSVAQLQGAPFSYSQVAQTLQDLNMLSTGLVLEYDLERVIPAFNRLGRKIDEKGSWYDLSRKFDSFQSQHHIAENPVILDPDTTEPKALMPVLLHCVHSLYDSDGVICRCAFKALKMFVATCSRCATDPWLNLIESTFVPTLRMCLPTKNENVRKYLILLVSEIARLCFNFPTIHLFKDLNILIRDDDPELDFFLNITHVQTHRKSKAFSTLRNILVNKENKDAASQFSQQSLSNVLLPITLHFVFESDALNDGALALEAVATLGAIAQHMNWSRYNNLLRLLLQQMSRKIEQERFIVGSICSVLDAFNFEVKKTDVLNTNTDETSENDTKDEDNCEMFTEENCATLRTLQNFVLSKIEDNLIKEDIDKNGSYVKSLRAPLVLAMTKLLLKLPCGTLEMKLPRLLLMICETLKSRDSRVRDSARETLSKVVSLIDIKYISDVIHQMTVSLNEGYQLHVRSKTLHSVLLSLSQTYEHNRNENNDKEIVRPFDDCAPAFMDLIQQELFGTASEMKETIDIKKKTINEAIGNKGYDSLEIVCKLLHFNPSTSCVSGKPSAIHVVIQPLLERLSLPDTNQTTVRKLRDCLNRVVIGISHNGSVEVKELLPFVHSFIAPLFQYHSNETGAFLQSDDEDDLHESDEDDNKIEVSNSKYDVNKEKKGKREKNRVIDVFTWLPSSMHSAKSEREAHCNNNEERKELHKVQDGANAPKLTGSSRHINGKKMIRRMKADAKDTAIFFGLSLLHSCLKKRKFDWKDVDILAMVDPFVSVLTKCVKICKNNEIIVLSFRCLLYLLRWDLPSVPLCAVKLGTYTLQILSSLGGSSKTKDEVNICCFKTLTFLLSNEDCVPVPKFGDDRGQNRSQGIMNRANLLTGPQMDSLISILHGSITGNEHHNSTFGLIKSILHTEYMCSELYDLMEKILQLSVQSLSEAIRNQCSSIFIHFMINYPLGENRLEEHLKQLILNIKYEHEDGRLSAISLLSVVIDRIPINILQEKVQLFFLPLILQLVNDESTRCREKIAQVVSSVYKRVSYEILQTLYEYNIRWLGDKDHGENNKKAQRTASQLVGIFVESRPDFMKRGDHAKDLLSINETILEKETEHISTDISWELVYFNLLLFERLTPFVERNVLCQRHTIWKSIIEYLTHPHLWIRQSSLRIIYSNISLLNPKKIEFEEYPFSFLQPGSIYELTKNCCLLLQTNENKLSTDLVTLIVKALSWIIQALHFNPGLCKGITKDVHPSVVEVGKMFFENPVSWLIRRLSRIANTQVKTRRDAIYKSFAAFASLCDSAIIAPHLELMLEPLHRTITEKETIEKQSNWKDKATLNTLDLPDETLTILEKCCGTEAFVIAYAKVKSRAKEKRENRKERLALEAIHNPKLASQRRIKKQQNEKKRKKQRMEEKRNGLSRKKKR